MKYKFSGVPLNHHDSDYAAQSQKASLALIALAAATGLAIIWNTPRPAENEAETLQPALGAVSAIAKNFTQSQIAPLEAAVPGGWKTNQIAAGVVAYSVPAEDVETVADPVTATATATATAAPTLDGTRFPYVSEVRGSDFLAHPIALGVYQWTDTWAGEGYSREYDRRGKLVAEREGGVDVEVTFVYDSNIKDPTKPNLMIMVQNNQDKTGQLTNLSAFLNDPKTGAAIARQDFAQLPPTYDVIATRNGGFGGTEVKTLDPLGTVTFAYRVSLDELNRQPIKLQGNNVHFNERLQEIASLEAQGWVVKEVPPAR
jgi:hypothetical protein